MGLNGFENNHGFEINHECDYIRLSVTFCYATDCKSQDGRSRSSAFAGAIMTLKHSTWRCFTHLDIPKSTRVYMS